MVEPNDTSADDNTDTIDDTNIDRQDVNRILYATREDTKKEHIHPLTPKGKCDNCGKEFPAVKPVTEDIAGIEMLRKKKIHWLAGGLKVKVRTEEDIANNVFGSKNSKEAMSYEAGLE
jgi:hypothetical protein